jgi:hypothetical protein
LRRGIQDCFDGGDASNGFLGEDAQFQRESACKFAIEVDGAAAHAGDDTSVLDFGAFELDEDDGLLRTEKVVQDAEDFEIEFFDLIAREDGVGVTLHARADLAEWEDFAGFLGGGSLSARTECDCKRHEGEKHKAARL